MRAIHVLIIDDDPLMQQLANDVLADRGIKLLKAYDTAEAEAIRRQHRVDVILCDVLMNPENGLDYYHRLRRQAVQTPFILMSAQVSPLGMQNAVKVGHASYLIKPFGIDQIYQRILEVLAQN